MVSCNCSPKTAFAVRVVYASVGIAIGILVCAAFSLRFDNSHAGFWGLGSAVFAAISLVLFIYLYVVYERQRKHPTEVVLAIFGCLGAVGMGVGVGGFIAYLGLGIIDAVTHDESGFDIIRSYFLVCVWNFMTFKWGITTFYYSLRSFRLLKPVAVGYRHVEEETSDPDLVEKGLNDDATDVKS